MGRLAAFLGVLLIWEIVGQGPSVLAVGAGGWGKKDENKKNK